MGLSKRNPRGNFNWQSRYLKKKAINCGELNEPVGPVVAPVADFSGTPTTVTEGDTVNFTDLSTNTPTAWSWSFPGGTPATDTLQNPSIVYNTAGTYNVDLTASNGGGSGFVSKPNYITVIPPPPVADFSASSTNIYAGDTVNFTDLSTNTPTAWSWVFAGGTPATSATQNPSVVYNTVGTYGVDLTATNAGGSDPESKPNYITVNYPYLLDLNPGAAAAYSVRRLSSTYTGAAIRVRRSSDNTEQDIGFSGVNLDTTALSSFVGSGSGFVVRWYDQSGNGNDFFINIATNQPTIINSGTLSVVNLKPAIKFDGSNDYYIMTNSISLTGVISIFTVARLTRNHTTYSRLLNGKNDQFVYIGTDASENIVSGYGNGASWSQITANSATSWLNTQRLVSSLNNGTDSQFVNNVAKTPRISAFASFNNIFMLGGTYITGINNIFDQMWQGEVQELIIYPNYQISNNNGINTNIMTYYGI